MEHIVCQNTSKYEEILDWLGFAFETSRLQSHETQRKLYACGDSDGEYGIAEANRIIDNVVLKNKTKTDWEKVATYDAYFAWSRTTEDGRTIYTVSKDKPGANDGGYYAIATALNFKNIGRTS